MKFYVRSGKFAHRVVYLLDSVTPEGFAFWINGDGNLIEPLRDFPEQGKPDCVVVSSYAPLPESKFEALKSYVANGGTALFFGVNHPQLDELNPLKLNRSTLTSRRTTRQMRQCRSATMRAIPPICSTPRRPKMRSCCRPLPTVLPKSPKSGSAPAASSPTPER